MKKGYMAPVRFTEEEIPDQSEREILQDGLNMMVKSTLDLVEFCIAQRQKQYLMVIREAMKGKTK